VNWPGRGADHPPPSVTEFENEFEAVPKYVGESVLVEFIFCCYSDNCRGVVVMLVIGVVIILVIVIVVKRGALCSVILTKYHSGDQIKKTKVDGVCSTYGGEELFIQSFGGEAGGKETTWKT